MKLIQVSARQGKAQVPSPTAHKANEVAKRVLLVARKQLATSGSFLPMPGALPTRCALLKKPRMVSSVFPAHQTAPSLLTSSCRVNLFARTQARSRAMSLCVRASRVSATLSTHFDGLGRATSALKPVDPASGSCVHWARRRSVRAAPCLPQVPRRHA